MTLMCARSWSSQMLRPESRVRSALQTGDPMPLPGAIDIPLD
jgi:hypothetical protein